MAIKKAEKRDGTIVDFDKEKIVTAVNKASQAVQDGDRDTATRLATKVVTDLDQIYGEDSIPKVEDIQDIVEKVLIEEGHYATAKAYILYRQQRKQKRREKGKLLNKTRVDSVDKKFSLKALRVLASRYLLRNKEGEIIESPKQLFARVATTITVPDILRDEKVFSIDADQQSHPDVDEYLNSYTQYDGKYQFADHKINKWIFKRMAKLYKELDKQGHMKVSFSELLQLFEQDEFADYHSNWQDYFDLMVDQDFLPNSPTLMNAGTRLGQLSACFVLPIEDDMRSIMNTAKEAALIFQSGGGVGINYSKLRPEGDIVASTSGVASGPISFMRIIDAVTDVVKQGGKRRGANMGVLDIGHPDIKNFIKTKEEEGQFENFNISVGIWSDFWKSFYNRSNSEFQLTNPRNGQVATDENPYQLLELISHSAWESADPGVLFFDRINQYNVIQSAKSKVTGTNPCGEQPLYEYESCNLGSINLHNFTDGTNFDWTRFENVIHKATRFLDNVIDMNDLPISKIERATKQTRKIGLGVMGLANLLYEMEIPYNSKQGYELMDQIAETITYFAMDASADLAQQRGKFPIYEDTEYPEGNIPIAGYYESVDHNQDWNKLIDKITSKGLRNAMHTTIAPTGSISMIGDTSNGIEPEFSLAYEKQVTAGDFYYSNRVLEKKLKAKRIYSEELLERISNNYGTLTGLDNVPQQLQEIFVTALNIHYTDHLFAQAIWQNWISASISKTINMPNSATVEDIFRSYLLAHELGLKGVTVYRDGSKTKQVLTMKGEQSQKIKTKPSKYFRDFFTNNVDNNFLQEEFESVLQQEQKPSVSESEGDNGRKNRSLPNKGLFSERKNVTEDELASIDIRDEYSQCPNCGGLIVHEGGCNKCINCGWSACSIS